MNIVDIYTYIYTYCFIVSVTGKSSLLSAIENLELPVPEHVDIFHLRREMPPSDKTALQAVCDVDKERIRLEHESEILATKHDQGIEQFMNFSELIIIITYQGCLYILLVLLQ